MFKALRVQLVQKDVKVLTAHRALKAELARRVLKAQQVKLDFKEDLEYKVTKVYKVIRVDKAVLGLVEGKALQVFKV